MISGSNWLKVISGMLIILTAVGLAFYPLPVLVVGEDHKPPAILVPLIEEHQITLEYFHSVQKSPVQEHFVLVPGNDLKLVSTTYQTLGVGLPFLSGEGDLVNDKGTFRLTGLNRVFREIRLAVMPVTYQGLVYGSKHYTFGDYFKSGSLVTISVQSYSPGQIVWKMITMDREENRE